MTTRKPLINQLSLKMSINNQSGKRATSTTGSTTTKIELRILTSKTGYNFPSIFSFPPFFTKQPNQQTWAHQVRLWHQLILSYCRYHKLHKIDISSSATRGP
ncbi:hypothetical protein PSHT_13430 [Puccinia striiformis]|uniref:Uncharacterized protein n=1 Tax=Puccinia striiformis TaxID=27350 RepID=A0A2S4UQJ0_9BASI|nr:hypothetical protein PSHT_13430 [Puccinia striiformis]